MKPLKFIFFISLLPVLCFSQKQTEEPVNKENVLATMKRATAFMLEKVSYKGGYVWSYLPDLSRRWGEMEAKKTMIWVQPPGTGTMGHLFLDAYHLTHDEYYYQAAEQTVNALIAGQHASGGWNYLIDFAGEKSLTDWYKTIGANGWRLEEFQHYYGNATFDDGGTSEAATLLLRMYLEKRDDKIKAALDKSIKFILDSQYPVGGWPQRYPPTDEFSKQGKPDYTSFITFNDDVAQKNISFLIMCYQTLGDKKLLPLIIKAMDAFAIMQMPSPQAGWSMQYTLDLKPTGARTYEPTALSTSVTESNIFQLMNFYCLTGDKKYIARIPEALDWLVTVRLPDSLIKGKLTHPLFIEIGTNKPLFLHRRGSNVVNGEYYADYNPENTLSHYRSMRFIDIDSLRRQYNFIRSLSTEKIIKESTLFNGDQAQGLPKYFSLKETKISDLNTRHLSHVSTSADQVKKLISGLGGQGFWITPLISTTHPYIGPGPKKVTPGDFSTQRVGDKYDTSPYFINKPIEGISTGQFIRNMGLLIEYLEGLK
jgi:hypothetical protein